MPIIIITKEIMECDDETLREIDSCRHIDASCKFDDIVFLQKYQSYAYKE